MLRSNIYWIYTVSARELNPGPRLWKNPRNPQKIPHVNSLDELAHPERPNGIKLEKFVLEVNIPAFQQLCGVGSPSGRRARSVRSTAGHPISLIPGILNNNAIQVENNNNEVQKPSTSKYKFPVVVEISPLVSYTGDGLETFISGTEKVTPSSSDGHPGLEGDVFLKVHTVQPMAQQLHTYLSAVTIKQKIM
ncbi:UDP-N-acetylhexosamine pyrophosphorylase-like protein 1 [Folsomia candida]|uniref:UDP-N-acetylhexosamine pyrophosphorylase-like protein 1 n=1 Tax=Folsomia candida TaxID=158441 RepID=A0A226DJ22_FOLCA|nr:UDP-N-acetylhexosamine pyrophosphorylase-like protein 1 [Folsomia candida]